MSIALCQPVELVEVLAALEAATQLDVADRGDGEVRVQRRRELERGVARVGHLVWVRVRVS